MENTNTTTTKTPSFSACAYHILATMATDNRIPEEYKGYITSALEKREEEKKHRKETAEKRKAKATEQKQTDYTAFVANIVSMLSTTGEKAFRAKDFADYCDISIQKASAVLRALVTNGNITVVGEDKKHAKIYQTAKAAENA